MQNLKHKYILEQIDFNRDIYLKYMDDQLYQSKEKDYVVLKLAERGCLCNIIGESGRFSEPVARYYMK